MGTCTCTGDVRPTSTNYGGTLKWIWAEGNKSTVWHGPFRYCNPYSCSNSRCKANGCAQARAQFCSQHGFHCQSLGKKVCWGDSCPGGLKTCLNSPAESAVYGALPLCADKPGGGGGGSGGGGGAGGADARNCSQGNVIACFSEMGNAVGHFFTDAAKTGGEQLPLWMLLGAGILLVVLLKK